jgi:Uma2 family endonuclease
MSVMATPLAGLPFGRPLTVDDLERMPDDGHRYELLDGTLLVSPAPNVWHQEVAFALARCLHDTCPPGLRVVIAPFEWRRGRRTALQPDVLVARREDLLAVENGKYLGEPPLLAVEVYSPSTKRIDRLSKLSAYEEAGVASYWLIDPDPDTPALTALDLVDGRYVEVTRLTGAQRWTAGKPFPVELCPDDLVAGLRRNPTDPAR